MAESYLVEGAKIKCLCGSKTGELGVEDKNVCLLRVPIAIEDDCKPGINIPSFGICSQTGQPCIPMILGKWLCPHEQTKINGSSAITTDSGLICGRGGLILSETSGQETIQKIWMSFFEEFKDLYGLGRGPYSSDPVNLCTGNFVLEAKDLEIKGIRPLSFVRTYNSLSKESYSCGVGWSHNHEIYLMENKDTIEIHIGTGGQVRTFQKTAQGYQTEEKVKESLSKEMNGYIYQDFAKKKYFFNRQGLCEEIQDSRENITKYSYEKGQLVKVENLCGTLLFSYNKEKQLTQVYDHTGRMVELYYEKGHLVKVTNLLGGWKEYVYDEQGRLKEEITPYGVKKVINQFDERGRTKKQEFPDGAFMGYEYEDEAGKVTLIGANGNKAKFYHDKWQRDCRITSSDGQIEKTYNEKHQLESLTDPNGNTSYFQYDERGNICSMTDVAGYETRFEYDRRNNPIKAILPDGAEVKTNYDAKGRIKKTTDPLGRSYEYQYHQTGQPETILQPDGSKMEMRFDKRGNILEIADPSSAKIQYEYDALNRLVLLIDGNGNKTQFIYNKNNDVIKEINALGNSREYHYNWNGKLIEAKEEDGYSYQWEYDEMNHPVKAIDKEGRETLFEYNIMWDLCQKTDPNEAVTKYIYNKSRRLEKVISPEGGETQYQYDKNGNCIKQINPDGAEIHYYYDGLNRLVQTDYPDHSSDQMEYNYADKITKFIDANGGEYQMEYDLAGQKIKQITPSGAITSFEYNELGMIKKIIEPMERITRYEYSPGGRLKRVLFPDESYIDYTYDLNGNVIRRRDQTGYQIDFTYDVLDRLVFMESNQGQKKTITYDAMGNVLTMTNSKGITTNYEYTKSGKLKAVLDPLGTKTCYTYDEMDRLLIVKQVTTFEEEWEEVQKINQQKERLLVQYKRNLEGYLISSQNGEGDTTYYQRDYRGKALTITDAEGKDTHYTYDYAGNIKKVLYPDGKKMQMEYDALHQLIQLEDWMGVTKIERNLDGMPVCITDYRGNTMQYEWDCYGNKTKMRYPDGKEIFYKYGKNQKLARIQWEKEFIEYEYDEKGYLEKKNYSNGKTSTYGYNKNGKLQFILHKQERELLKYQYEYDIEGLPIAIREDNSNGSARYRYEYDALNRIIKVEKDLCFLRGYEYDGFGNRIKKKERNGETYYQYNEANQLIREETGEYLRTYDYDKRGNIHHQYENGELSETYFYNGKNLLDRVKKKSGIELFYEYDGFGHQVRKQVLERELEKQSVEETFAPQIKTIEYMIDFTRNHHNIIKEQREKEEKNYIWEPQSHELVGLVEEKENYFYQNDRLGSPVRLLDHQGRTVSSYGYEEFGKQIDQKILQKEQLFGFIGYEIEKETELYHTERRWYNSDIGVFYGIDSIKGNTVEPFTIHAYLFCLNNPLHYIDVDGAMTKEEKEEKAKQDGIEAHRLFQQYFKWYFRNDPYYTAEVEFKIKDGSLDPKYEYGRADMVLFDDGAAEIYEIKPSSRAVARCHSEDIKQLERYIEKFQIQEKKDAFPGEYFFKDQTILIPSERNPDFYIRYYSHYEKEYTLIDETGRATKVTYVGFIYWEHVKKNKIRPQPYLIWIPNKNGKGGNFETDLQAEISSEGRYNDDIAAAIGWTTVGIILWWCIKAGVSIPTGQWWILGCG